MKNQKQGKKNIPLSKKQRKRMEKQGIKIKESATRAKMPKETKLLVALISLLVVLAIVCATFGTILIVHKVNEIPYASEYDTVTMSRYLATGRMGKSFYTGNTFDFTEIEKTYADKDMTYFADDGDYIRNLLLSNRKEVALGQKTTVIGDGDDVALYITDIFRGGTPADAEAEKANRIPTKTMPLGTYISSISFMVGSEYFGADFDEKLIAMNLAPVETGREVRYNGNIDGAKILCISYDVYKGTKKANAAADASIADRNTWGSKDTASSIAAARVDLTSDLEQTLATAITENCPQLGEAFTIYLENYSLSGDGSNKADYKFDVQVHFAVETEVYKDITFTFPTDFFTEGDGATLKALNGKEVTFRVIVAGMDDYEIPVLDRAFITETLKVEVTATTDEGAKEEYKQKMLEEINASLAEVRERAKIQSAFLQLSQKASEAGFYITSDYSKDEISTETRKMLYNDLIKVFITRYGSVPTTSELNTFAASYFLEIGGTTEISSYSEYLSYVTSSQIPQELLMYYIFRDSELEITDEMLEEAYASYVGKMVDAAEDPETYNETYFVNYFGKDTLYKLARRDLVYQLVSEYLLENNQHKLS